MLSNNKGKKCFVCFSHIWDVILIGVWTAITVIAFKHYDDPIYAFIILGLGISYNANQCQNLDQFIKESSIGEWIWKKFK